MKHVSLRTGSLPYKNQQQRQESTRFFNNSVKKMAFKLVFLAAVCVAQGFAFRPPVSFRGLETCKNPSAEIQLELEEAMHGVEEVTGTVSVATAEAYVKGDDIEVIIACFREQRENFIALGKRVSSNIRDASQEIGGKLREKADKYAKIMEVPLKNIAITMRALPETVYEFVKNKEFAKAAEAVRQARKIVEENSRILGKAVKDMAGEVPELADRTVELAQKIRKEAREGCDAINKAITECIRAGGPKGLEAEDEESEPSDE